MTILVIEDDTFFREFYTSKLTESGFHVESAEDGEIGLEKIQSVKPDLILLDLVMPIRDGFSVLDTLQKQGNSTPVLVFSTLGQENDVAHAVSLGAKDYVNKTFFDFEMLLRKIKSLINTSASIQEPSSSTVQEKEVRV